MIISAGRGVTPGEKRRGWTLPRGQGEQHGRERREEDGPCGISTEARRDFAAGWASPLSSLHSTLERQEHSRIFLGAQGRQRWGGVSRQRGQGACPVGVTGRGLSCGYRGGGHGLG